jgi:hypothetical protein
MRRSTRPREAVSLSKSVQHQVNMYALAASAAGVNMLALSQSADAKIVYTPAHHLMRVNQSYNLDLNHDGTTDFRLTNKSSTFGHSAGGALLSKSA